MDLLTIETAISFTHLYPLLFDHLHGSINVKLWGRRGAKANVILEKVIKYLARYCDFSQLCAYFYDLSSLSACIWIGLGIIAAGRNVHQP